jgi:hypothetical protein
MSFTKFRKLSEPAPTEMVGVGNTSGTKTSEAEPFLKERLPIIKCECGAEILLLPDLKAMDRAINAHVAEHRKEGKNPFLGQPLLVVSVSFWLNFL